MNDFEMKLILEAMLMSSDSPISIEKLHAYFANEDISIHKLRAIVDQLAQDYAERAIELKETAKGYSFQTRERFKVWISRLIEEKPAKFSSALLETLAIIAYKQPVSRADIEDIRGVAVSSPMLKTLLERDWIRVAGYKDVPGKPAVYTTTKNFLDYFNLKNLNELPEITLQQQALEHLSENIDQPTDEIVDNTILNNEYETI